MCRAIGSLTTKSAALLTADDLKSQRRVCGTFWRYYDANLPGGGDMTPIEALLLGVTIQDINRAHHQRNVRMAGEKMRLKRRCEEAQRNPPPTYWEIMEDRADTKKRRRKRKQKGNVVYLAGAGPKGGAA